MCARDILEHPCLFCDWLDREKKNKPCNVIGCMVKLGEKQQTFSHRDYLNMSVSFLLNYQKDIKMKVQRTSNLMDFTGFVLRRILHWRNSCPERYLNKFKYAPNVS